MNYSEVKELLQAGFTAEEIRGMLITPADNPQNPQDNPQPQQKQPEEQPQPKQPEEQPKQPEEQPEKNQDDAKFNQLNATMERLIKTIQVSNLNNNSFDGIPSKADIDTQVDQIMAGIIRPERKKEVNP